MTFDLPKWSGAKREQLQQSLLEAFTTEHSKMNSACQYPINTGGKRIRPLFLFAGLETLGKEISSDAYLAASALELIHTYSLVHDDLPCMDDDDFRREKPTVHKKYDEGVAVLVGDALLTKAFELLSKITPRYVPGLVNCLARAAGSTGMIGGQSLDIGFEGTVETVEKLTLLHRRKTGALIKVALEMASILGDATSEEHDTLLSFGHHIGFAFQLADDLLDAEEDAKDNGPPSFVKLMGFQNTQTAAQQAMSTALNALEEFSERSALQALAKFTVYRQF